MHRTLSGLLDDSCALGRGSDSQGGLEIAVSRQDCGRYGHMPLF